LVISNFQELVGSAESCGRDSVLQFITQGNDGVPRIVNIAPDALALALDPDLAAQNRVTVHEPKAGATHEIVMVPGKTYAFQFDPRDVAKTVDGTNLMLSFKNGGLVIMRDYVPVMNGDLPPALTLADGTVIDAGKLVVATCAPAEPVVAAAPKPHVADIEPAAGGQPKKVAKMTDTAAAVADIEPAAGGASAPISGGRGGGFSAGVDPADFGGLGRLGPLGPTNLAIGLPRVDDTPVARGEPRPTAAPPSINPPAAPQLIVQNERVYEDSTLRVNVGTTAPVGTTTLVTITGFPAGWTMVDPRGGTFDPVTRTWSISVPAGQNFAGGPDIRPPANADGDLVSLAVSAVATDTTTGLSSRSNGTITIVTDAVADGPTLSASAQGVEDQGALLTINTAPTDLDGSERIVAVYVGPLPAGFSLSRGTLQNDGRYLLDPAGLNDVRLVAPANYSGSVNIDVTSVVREVNLSGNEFDLTNNEASRTVSVPVAFGAVADQPALSVDPVCILEDGSAVLPIRAVLVDRDGSESMTVRVENIPAGWGVEPGLGTFDAATRVWSVTLAAGQDFTGGPILRPPANSDVDAVDLRVVATTTETSNGATATRTVVAIANVDAVADVPNLFVVRNVGGQNGTALPLTVQPSLNDGDGSETLSVRITGMPAGASLNNGVLQNDGSWLLTPAQLGNLTVTTPVGYRGTFNLTVTAIATETNLSGVDCDPNNNVASRSDTITVAVGNSVPVIGDATSSVSEVGSNHQVNGTVGFDYGADGRGTTGTIAATGVFSSGGSRANDTLTSHGIAVVVTQDNNTYIGRAGNVEVFRLVVNQDGSYRFDQFANLDHGAINVVNDTMTLNFGVRITDRDGDTDTGTISINVQDSRPTAADDSAAANNGTAGGNVLGNDNVGTLDQAIVSSVSFGNQTILLAAGTNVIEGAFGTLRMTADGAYTYQARNGATGSDVFTYVIRDRDGDTATARLTIGTNDGVPVIGDSLCEADETWLNNANLIIMRGDFTRDYGADGPGAVTLDRFASSGSQANGTLTSLGVPVVVTSDGLTYTGRAGGVVVFTMVVNAANNTYEYQQFRPLDHADGTNANDVITLDFGIKITDRDGDTDTGVLRVTVADDAPVAQNDQGSVSGGANVATGNVLANDAVGQDQPGAIVQVVYNNVVYPMPTSGSVNVIAAFGTLVMNSDGTYRYTPNNGANGGDVFTYVMRDRDGDRSTATLTIGTADGAPVIGDQTRAIDEVNAAQGQVILNSTSGQLDFNYGADGAGATGTIAATGIFSSSGSRLNGVLTSNGFAVNVTQTGNTYSGVAGGVEVFRLVVNADGSYRFNQYDNLDHAGVNATSDVIALNFGVQISDADGDRDTGTITINVQDSLPFAVDDGAATVNGVASGNVLANDGSGTDNPGRVASVSFGGQVIALINGPNVIEGTFGTLRIDADGSYSYQARNGVTGSDVFTYVMRDRDGDTSTARLTVGVNDGIPQIDDVLRSAFEWNVGGDNVRSGQLSFNYGSDGAGSISLIDNSFVASGSRLNNALTSGGVPVVVTLTGNTWTAMAGATKIFTLSLAADGAYVFERFGFLDHAFMNPTDDPNIGPDIITLSFGTQIVDRDGDRDTGVIKIDFYDDWPIAFDDVIRGSFGTTSTGNVLTNDDAYEAPFVLSVVFKGQTYTVDTAGQTVINGDHGRLTIERDGDYTYRPYDPVTETLCLDPTAADVNGAANDPDIYRNGIKVTAIDPRSGAALSDLTWISGDLNIDDTWWGEQGLGVAGGNTKLIDGVLEGVRIDFDQPQDDVCLVIGSFNHFIADDPDVVEPFLQARVYLQGGGDPVIVPLTVTYDGTGFVSCYLYANQFNGQLINRIDLYSTDPRADWSLYNVKYDQTSAGGTDQFTYTVEDRDGDRDQGVIQVTSGNGVAPPIVDPAPRNPAIISFDDRDPTTLAINDFITATSPKEALVAANDRGDDAPIILPMPAQIDDQNQAA
jgi:T1SS-143 domain-containing protein